MHIKLCTHAHISVQKVKMKESLTADERRFTQWNPSQEGHRMTFHRGGRGLYPCSDLVGVRICDQPFGQQKNVVIIACASVLHLFLCRYGEGKSLRPSASVKRVK